MEILIVKNDIRNDELEGMKIFTSFYCLGDILVCTLDKQKNIIRYPYLVSNLLTGKNTTIFKDENSDKSKGAIAAFQASCNDIIDKYNLQNLWNYLNKW